MNIPVPLDHFPVNALTSKVFSFMVKKGKHFSGKVTPLFASMLVQLTEDEGATSERPSEPQPTPFPPHPSEVHVEPQSDPSPRPSPTTYIPDSILEDSSRNQGGQSSSEKSLSGNEGDMILQNQEKLRRKPKPVIIHHKAWMKSVSMKQRLAGKKSLKTQWMQKESVSKQGRKPPKAEPSVHKDPLFDKLADDTLDYMDTEIAQDVGRTRNVVNEEKKSDEDAVSTEDVVSTDKEKEEVSTDRPDEGTDDQTEGRSDTPTTQTPTPTTFGDDETIAQVLIIMSQNKEKLKEKEKGVDLKDVEETERPRPTSTRSLLTLKPLPKIDPKDKGEKKIEEEDESDTESKYSELKRRMEADRLLALRLQEKIAERSIHVWKREKILHDTIAAQRRFLAEQRAITIKNKPPTRTQLRNQMMTYLKHVGNKKHSDLKNKTFEEIQALYEKVKRFDESFTAVGSTEDERKIKEMNEGAKDLEQKRIKKKVAKETPKTEDTAKVPAKVDVTEQGTKKRKGGHIKMLARKRKRPQSDVNSDDVTQKGLKIVTFKGTMDSEILERKSIIARLDKISSPDRDYLVIYRANGNFIAFNCLLEIMMESSQEENDQSDFWDDQQDWEIVTWRLYEACRVYILELKDGIVIYMLQRSVQFGTHTNVYVDTDLRHREMLMHGLESMSIRRIQGVGYGILEFLGAQIRRIFLDGYDVLVFRTMVGLIAGNVTCTAAVTVVGNEVDVRFTCNHSEEPIIGTTMYVLKSTRGFEDITRDVYDMDDVKFEFDMILDGSFVIVG
ncbi:hypothetical protein Tco_0967821 [Tanacetum coccineum]